MQNYYCNYLCIKPTTLLYFLAFTISYSHANTPTNEQAISRNEPKPTDIVSQQLNSDLPIATPTHNEPTTVTPKTNDHKLNTAMDVNADYLLAHPQLLQQAMLSVIAQQNMAGIQEILPIYAQWTGHDPDTLLLAQAMLARYQQHPKIAIDAFSQLLTKYPQNDLLRWQLTLALLENRQYKEAQLHLTQLQDSQQIPPALITNYQQWIAKQGGLQWQLDASIAQDNNINRAPDDKHYGRWTFEDPIADKALVYSFQLGKQWHHNHGYFHQLQANYSARNYHKQTQYNDNNLRLSTGIGWADAKQQYQFAPVWSYRLYGGRPYSRSLGLRVNSQHKLTDTNYLYTAAEVGRIKHIEQKRQFLNNRNYLTSATWLHQLDKHQSISAGIDYYRQYKTRDADDSYRQKGVRVNWQKNWQQGQGFITQLGGNYNERDYEGASFFSNQQIRADKEYAIDASIGHEQLNFANVLIPKLTFRHQRLDSNDASKSYTINNVGAVLEMRF